MLTCSDNNALARFLADYSAWILGCGATCIRTEKNVQRIAAEFGFSAIIAVYPDSVEVIMRNNSGECVSTAMAEHMKIPISFALNTSLSRLSWDVADGKLSFHQMLEAFRRIIHTPRSHTWRLPIVVAIANASFCRLFGGDPMAMLIVAIATLAGFSLKIFLFGRNYDTRLVVFLCALISSLIGGIDYIFSFGTTPAIALGTSILYLVPGIPFINSFSDLICRHYISAIGRFFDATILTICLSAGLCAAMFLIHAGMF